MPYIGCRLFYSAASSLRQGKTVPRMPLIISQILSGSSAGAVVVGSVVVGAVVVVSGRVVGTVVGTVVGSVVVSVVVTSVVATTGCSFIGILTLMAESTPIAYPVVKSITIDIAIAKAFL